MKAEQTQEVPPMLHLLPLRTPLSSLGLCVLAGAAHAQDTPAVYSEGIWGGGGRVLRLQPGGLSGSRLGFRGRENPGGGLNADFVLETALDMDDGSYGQNALFSRRSHVPARIDNAIEYESPVWGGSRFGVLGGFGEVADSSSLMPLAHRRSYIVGAAYSFGSLRLHGAYLSVDDRSIANQDGSSWWLGADYRLGDSLVKIQYVVNRPRYLDNARTEGLGIGYEYSLSKRTTLYTGASYFRNQDGAGLGRASFSTPSGITSGTDNDLTQWVGGMRFSF